MAASKLQAFWNHPAGPKTIHFWAPTFKWVISIANVADFSKPPEKISYPQQIAVTCTGLIWSRYSMVIIPFSSGLQLLNGASVLQTLLTSQSHLKGSLILSKLKNWNLFGNSIFMAGTGLYQVTRKIRHDYMAEVTEAKE
ncbi:mitochondrial pyruvate carrier 4-like isoform X1 [Castanea sativa]|uniref:mitochondrial pyruvate carrier 4-like isoform X1 n=1 Tax=Castanea sativa TaxID=21020 RepID=UPI003F64DDB5